MSSRLRFGAVLAAGGSSRRFSRDGARKKTLLSLRGRPLLHWSLDLFAELQEIERIALVVPAEDRSVFHDLLDAWVDTRRGESRVGKRDAESIGRDRVTIVAGGPRRQDSVRRGLETFWDELDAAIVHDAARPLLRRDDLYRLLSAVERVGAAALGFPASDSLHRLNAEGSVESVEDRTKIWQVQTPQGALCKSFRRAYEVAGDGDFTDETSLLRLAGFEVALVEGARDNLKITHPGDEAFASFLLGRQERDARGMESEGGTLERSQRVGFGFDNHRLVPGRPLWIAGIEIPAEVGCDAHSDGDVVLHALTDALLGAIGGGDIGELFPDTDARWKDAASDRFVEEAMRRVRERGYRVANVDITVLLEAIKLSPYKRAMARRVREILDPTISEDAVNVKAKTMERCDAVGEGRAVAAQVAVLLLPMPGSGGGEPEDRPGA